MNSSRLLALSCCLLTTAANATDYSQLPWITRVPNGTFDVVFSITGKIENGLVSEYFRYEPIPESSIYQDIEWKVMPPKELVAVNPANGDKYLRMEGQNASTLPSVEFSFRITFYKVQVNFSKIKKLYPYNKDTREYKFYTRKMEETSKDSQGKKRTYVDLELPWVKETAAQLMRESGGNPLAYAKSAHRIVSSEFEYYTDDAPGIHPKNLLQSIESKRGHCGLRHRVFITLLRAAGIPARTINCNRPSGSPHVWAEFYLEKYGWIPINLARKAGDFSHFGMYNDHCIILKKDSCVTVATKSGRPCTIVQTRGCWRWNKKGTKGKLKVNFSITGSKVDSES